MTISRNHFPRRAKLTLALQATVYRDIPTVDFWLTIFAENGEIYRKFLTVVELAMHILFSNAVFEKGLQCYSANADRLARSALSECIEGRGDDSHTKEDAGRYLSRGPPDSRRSTVCEQRWPRFHQTAFNVASWNRESRETTNAYRHEGWRRWQLKKHFNNNTNKNKTTHFHENDFNQLFYDEMTLALGVSSKNTPAQHARFIACARTHILALLTWCSGLMVDYSLGEEEVPVLSIQIQVLTSWRTLAKAMEGVATVSNDIVHFTWNFSGSWVSNDNLVMRKRQPQQANCLMMIVAYSICSSNRNNPGLQKYSFPGNAG